VITDFPRKRKGRLRNQISLFLLGMWFTFLLILPGEGALPTLQLVSIEGTISPASVEYFKRALLDAENKKIHCLILQLDTPGGLDASMREIVKLIMNSKIPVVVYIAPRGARAASAGVFIALSSHLLAMAPGTNIGAAHPVALLGGMGETMEKKVVNDAAAYIRAIAEKKGRNMEWAEKTVRESVSATAEEALKLGVADIIAENEEELLQKLQGKEVLIDGQKVILNTKEAKIEIYQLRFKDKFLQKLSDPNLAYVLLMIGIWGIILEFFNPGILLPGIAGAICLILSFFALQILPFNLTGLLLILLAVVLFILEVKITSYGALTIGGVIALTLGSLMLIEPSAVYLTISWEYILAGVGVTVLLFVFIIFYAIKAQFRPPVTGEEGLVGMVGVARTDLNPTGKVYIHGELWNAVSLVPREIIKTGEEVQVIKVEGMKLMVKKKEG